MKKITAILLSVIMLISLASCSKKDDEDKNDAVTPSYAGTLEELSEKIYEKNPVEFAVAPTQEIDLANGDTMSYYLGISDSSEIERAVYSETMMGSQAYSLCLVKVKENANISELKNSIFENVNQRKWICVAANNLIVTSSGNVIMMVMVDSQLSETLAHEMADSFAEIVGGEDTGRLSRTEEKVQ